MTPRSDIDDLIQILRDAAPGGISLALHYRGGVPLLTVQTLPDAWVARYRAHSIGLRDPMIAWGFASDDPVRWDDPSLPDPFGIVSESRRFGLFHGVTVGCGQVTSRSMLHAARTDRAITPEEAQDLQAHLLRLHAMTERSGLLTPAQADALRLIASGDRQEAASARLGITRSALKARLAGARIALQARTTAEAIQLARSAGLL